MFALINLDGMEYSFHMVPFNHENIYCGFITSEAFEIGVCVGVQYFRICNFNDGSNAFVNSFSMINESYERTVPPFGENGTDFSGYTGGSLERIWKCGNDWITV